MNGIFRISSAGPLPVLAIILLLALVILIVPLLILGIAGATFSRLGFTWVEAVAVILLLLLGSFVNIPVWTFRPSKELSGGSQPVVFDAFTGEPVDGDQPGTTLALNLGGAVVPYAVSIFLLYGVQQKGGGLLIFPVAVTIFLVALITKYSTKVIPGAGIRAPLLLPSLSAIACGVLLTGGTGLPAAVTAFAGGSTGTSLGAVVLNISRIRSHGIRFVSIGGSGTFWAVFLCGILAALIA
jgi:uncharacterized membrane protein